MEKILIHPTVLSCPVRLAFLQLETGRTAIPTQNPKVAMLRQGATVRRAQPKQTVVRG